jgi:hypothetical protein
MLDLDSRQAIACAADRDALCQTGECAYLTRLEPAIMDLFTSSLGSLRFTRDPGGRVTGCILNRGRVLGFRFK